MSSKFSVLFICIFAQFGRVASTYCTGRYNVQCGPNQVCCNNQCVYSSNCYGQYCFTDSDCSGAEMCCQNNCQNSCSYYSYDPVPAIIGSVIGACALIVSILIYCCCRRRPRPMGGYVVANQPTTISTVATTTNYPGQQPYGYQQGYGGQVPQHGYGATGQGVI